MLKKFYLDLQFFDNLDLIWIFGKYFITRLFILPHQLAKRRYEWKKHIYPYDI